MSRSIHQSLLATALRCSVALLLLSGVSGAAQAQTETFLSSGMLTPLNVPDELTLPSFDPTLGSLQTIDLSLKFDICPTISVFNNTNAPVDFSNAMLFAPITFTGPGGLTLTANLTATIASGVAAPGINTFTPTGSWTYTVKSINPASFALWENQPADKVNLVVTPGSLTFKGTEKADGLFFGGSAIEWENISVAYKYLTAQAVPEPSGGDLSLIVGAAMVLIVMGRKARLRA
jgi:hypothetical protein